jgi:hypothetical protein
MRSSGQSDVRELEVYKMLEGLGIELGPGAVPRYGLMCTSAVWACWTRGSVHALTEWPQAAPDLGGNADLFDLEGQIVKRKATAH